MNYLSSSQRNFQLLLIHLHSFLDPVSGILFQVNVIRQITLKHLFKYCPLRPEWTLLPISLLLLLFLSSRLLSIHRLGPHRTGLPRTQRSTHISIHNFHNIYIQSDNEVNPSGGIPTFGCRRQNQVSRDREPRASARSGSPHETTITTIDYQPPTVAQAPSPKHMRWHATGIRSIDDFFPRPKVAVIVFQFNKH